MAIRKFKQNVYKEWHKKCLKSSAQTTKGNADEREHIRLLMKIHGGNRFSNPCPSKKSILVHCSEVSVHFFTKESAHRLQTGGSHGSHISPIPDLMPLAPCNARELAWHRSSSPGSGRPAHTEGLAFWGKH